MAGDQQGSEQTIQLHDRTVAQAPDAILWLDPAGAIRHANAAACHRLNYSYADLTSRAIFDLDASLGPYQGRDLRRLFAEELPHPHATQLLAGHGDQIPVEIDAAVVAHDQQTYICLFARDISACEQAGRFCRQSTERLRAIAHALPDLVCVVEEEGLVAEVLSAQENRRFAPVDPLLNRRLDEIFERPLADRFLSMIQKTIRTGHPEAMEYELTLNAAVHSYEARTAHLGLSINGRRGCVLIARDISDRRHTETLVSQNIYLREQLRHELNYGDIVGASAPIRKVFRNIEMVAATDATVLLTGETGTGKELVARAIHRRSRRSDRVLIKVNCSALPAGLMESELFGHEKGAFTGAAYQKKGRFELAHRGTLFLDEVGELPLDIQTKLLRVLQEKEFERVGGEQTLRVDVRIIAATHRDLEKEVRAGRFRADLYYRLNIFPIAIPPLRERKSDIPLLTNHFIQKFAKEMGKQIRSVHAGVIEQLLRCHWPGNVRELANILERAVILCQGDILQQRHIHGLSAGRVLDADFIPMEEMERRHILDALERAEGVLAGPRGAAALLQLNRSTLWSRMQKLGIHPSKTFS